MNALASQAARAFGDEIAKTEAKDGGRDQLPLIHLRALNTVIRAHGPPELCFGVVQVPVGQVPEGALQLWLASDALTPPPPPPPPPPKPSRAAKPRAAAATRPASAGSVRQTDLRVLMPPHGGHGGALTGAFPTLQR